MRFILSIWLTSAEVYSTASPLGTFFLVMVCCSNVQKKARTELDKVLNGRLPEHSDITSLPYLSAVVKEVYRYAAGHSKHLFLYAKCTFAFYRWQPLATW